MCSSTVAFWPQRCFSSLGETPLHAGGRCSAVSGQSGETHLSFDPIHSGRCWQGPMWGSLLTAFYFAFTANTVYQKSTFSFLTCSFLVSTSADSEEIPMSQPLSQFGVSAMPPVVRAHAVITLGKCRPAGPTCPCVSDSHPGWFRCCSKAVSAVPEGHSVCVASAQSLEQGKYPW